MANPSKQKGTTAERWECEFLNSRGFDTRRNPLHGAKDIGDLQSWIHGLNVCVEVKAGKRPLYSSWYEEAQAEESNAGADVGMMVHKPEGVARAHMGEWPVMLSQGDLMKLLAAAYAEGTGERRTGPISTVDGY